MIGVSKKMNFVVIEKDAGITQVILNRPELHNAFNAEMISELIAAFKDCANDNECRVVIIKSRGKNFSAGADLNWMKSMAKLDFESNQQDAAELAQLMSVLFTLKKPVIAQVQGASYGGALGLIACADIAIATADAKFCLSEVKIGLVPAVISPYVVRAMGARHAQRFFMTAEVMTATKAEQIGFVHEVVASENLDDAVNAMAKQIINNGPNAVSLAKALVHTVENKPIDASVIKHTTDLIATVRVSAEGQDGLGAFLNKTKPSWIQ